MGGAEERRIPPSAGGAAWPLRTAAQRPQRTRQAAGSVAGSVAGGVAGGVAGSVAGSRQCGRRQGGGPDQGRRRRRRSRRGCGSCGPCCSCPSPPRTPPPPPPRKKQAQKKNPEPEQKKQVPEKTEDEELDQRITNLNTILKENSSLKTLSEFFGNSNMNTYIKKLKNIKNKYGPTGNEFNLYNHLRASIPPKVDEIITQIKKEKERIAKNEENKKRAENERKAKNEEERRKAQALLNEQARRKKEKNEEERRKAQALLNEQARLKKEKNEENKRAQARRNEQARLNAEKLKRKALINQLEKNIPGIFENRFQTFKNEYGALHGPLKRLFENKTKHITSVSSKEKALKNALKNLKINPDQVLNLINKTNNNIKIKPTAIISKELKNKFMNKVIREMAPKNITNDEVANIKKKLKKSRKSTLKR